MVHKKLPMIFISWMILVLMSIPTVFAAITTAVEDAEDDVEETINECKEVFDAIPSTPTRYQDTDYYFYGNSISCDIIDISIDYLLDVAEINISFSKDSLELYYETLLDDYLTLSDEYIDASLIYISPVEEIQDSYYLPCLEKLKCPSNAHKVPDGTLLIDGACMCDTGYTFNSDGSECVLNKDTETDDSSDLDSSDNSDDSSSDVVGFSDVFSSHKNSDAILYLQENEIISGYPDGTFKPENTVNRAELLKILVGGKGITPTLEEYKNCFPDVKEDWFVPYVCYAKEEGWVSGYPDGTFKPAQEVNKAEAIKMLINSQEYSVSEVGNEGLFEDVASTDWFAPFVKVAKEKGLLEETGDYLSPSNPMSRAGISENIYRVMIVTEYVLDSFLNYLSQDDDVDLADDSNESDIADDNGGNDEIVVDEADVVHLSGSGTDVTDSFSLKEGLAIFSVNYSGESNFIVKLLGAENGTTDYIANEIDDYSGKVAVNISNDADYVLNVNSEGNWTVEIEQFEAISDAPSEDTFTGSGNAVVDFFEIDSGFFVFDYSHNGSSNFIVQLLDLEGNTVEYVSNEIGESTGSTASYIDDGIYLLSVVADGTWSIELKLLNSSDAQAKTTFSGEGNSATELFTLVEGLTTFNLDHNGSSNFIVELLDNSGRTQAYLSNEIGVFDGSVAEFLEEGIYLLNVRADGNWNISIE